MLLWGLGAVGFVCVALVLGQAARYRHERTIKDGNQLLSPAMRFALRGMAGARRQAAAAPAARRPWGDYERALEDWKTLDREHLETFKALARSLEMEG